MFPAYRQTGRGASFFPAIDWYHQYTSAKRVHGLEHALSLILPACNEVLSAVRQLPSCEPACRVQVASVHSPVAKVQPGPFICSAPAHEIEASATRASAALLLRIRAALAARAQHATRWDCPTQRCRCSHPTSTIAGLRVPPSSRTPPEAPRPPLAHGNSMLVTAGYAANTSDDLYAKSCAKIKSLAPSPELHRRRAVTSSPGRSSCMICRYYGDAVSFLKLTSFFPLYISASIRLHHLVRLTPQLLCGLTCAQTSAALLRKKNLLDWPNNAQSDGQEEKFRLTGDDLIPTQSVSDMFGDVAVN
ncbi:hypothetical protein B0H19DRAFT_1068383 [Mycena capillaripes]|nr:hypothetical protein B0H19DRAFT_1068383 [Mycena capillaripes]